jgi:hypothetical protein
MYSILKNVNITLHMKHNNFFWPLTPSSILNSNPGLAASLQNITKFNYQKEWASLYLSFY